MDKLIADGIKVDAIITDPPYGIFGGNNYGTTKINNSKGIPEARGFAKYSNDNEKSGELSWDIAIPLNDMWLRLNKIKKQLNSNIVIFGNDPFSYKLKLSNKRDYKYSVIWDKMSGGIGLYAKHQPIKQFEEIMVFYSNYNYADWVRVYFLDLLKATNKSIKYFKEKCSTSTASHWFTGGYQFSLPNEKQYEITLNEVSDNNNLQLYTWNELKKATTKTTYNPQMVKLEKNIVSKQTKVSGYGNKNVLGITEKLNKTYTHKYPTNIWQFKKVTSRALHPTQKPLELMRYIIKTYTNPNDIILDFACGSGTTLLACKLEGRKAIGIEISQKYCDIAIKRLEEQEQSTHFHLLKNVK